MEYLGQEIPRASSISEAAVKANTYLFDYSAGTAILVDVDFSVYPKNR